MAMNIVRLVLLPLALLLALRTVASGAEDPGSGWFPFDPPPDAFKASPMDLRGLNEKFAGEHGVIATRGDVFIHSANGQPVRFWGVNGPPSDLTGDRLRECARLLAKFGVNLLRMHGAVFNKAGDADPRKVLHAHEVVDSMKEQGIYTHLSIYFPLWMTPAADHPWLKGYDGKRHPFAALMFNPEFQERYRGWWKSLLLTPNPKTGTRLVDEAAVFGLEIQNEDSFLFWTFNPDQIPTMQLQLLEARFAAWLKARHGSLEAAVSRWNGQGDKRDDFPAGRVGFRPLWNLFNEKSARDRDTVAFLVETQKEFYAEMIRFLRSLGFRGVITAGNWATASPQVLGPLEKWSYTSGDFLDRHGYFSVAHKGDNAEWSIRNGHTYADRSALRFDGGQPGKPRDFEHPAMDITYDAKPSMISETTWVRPNRHRSEAPLYYAAYGSLQDSDAIVHFALDGEKWSVKPRFWMQPWTLMAPSQMAQFPAAALIYRRGLISTGDVLARVVLNTNDLLNLMGTPLPQNANFDELRLKDVPEGSDVTPGQRIDPLLHYAGRAAVSFSAMPGSTVLADLKPLINRTAQTVRSSTGELALDYGKGVLMLNAVAAQGASGNLGAGGEIVLGDVRIRSRLDNVHIVVVSLDASPLAKSRRMLLQVMSEERPTGFATEEAGNGLRRITDIGRDPWRVKPLEGAVTFNRGLDIQPLDLNGYPVGAPAHGTEFRLAAGTIYYLLSPR